jgi:hypothetical protein
MNKMISNQKIEEINKELAIGELALSQGLEGRARVCARRAAAKAVRSYLIQNNFEAPNNAILCLEKFLQLPGLPPNQKRIVKNLISRVDENFRLEVGINLLEEARELVNILAKT